MDWTFDFSRQADKFLTQQHITDDVIIDAVGRALRKLDGEIIAIDLKHLHDPWKGFYRVRIQKVRIIFSFDAYERRVNVAVIDFRDRVYRKV